MKTASLKIDIWDAKHELPSDMSDLAELLAPHVLHVASLCEGGCQAGEIVDEHFRGWWKIEVGK